MDNQIFQSLQEEMKDRYLSAEVKHGLLEFYLTKENFFAFIQELKEKYLFDIFLDVTAVDYLGKRKERFELVHHFYSTTHFLRIRTKIKVEEASLEIPSLLSLYGSAAFMERECHDMYGIKFSGNDDLRPILLYGGFEGHPLRKDYPIDKEQPLVPFIK